MKITVVRGPIKHDYLRYEQDQSYDVKPALGQLFIGYGWADNAAKDAVMVEAVDVRELSEDQVMELHEQDVQRAAALQGRPEPDLDVHDTETGAETEF